LGGALRLLIVASTDLLALSPKPLALGLKSLALGAGACVLAGLLAACDVNIKDGKPSFAVFSVQATQDWSHRYPLAADGRVEVVNINGPINIAAGAPGTVDVRATITAKALTDATAKDILSKGRVQEISEPGRVHIETMSPRGVHGSYEVRYDVRVPAASLVDLSMTSGSIQADGLTSKLKLVAINGPVELNDVEGAVEAVSVNGSLMVKLVRVSAPVRLEMTNGRLALEFPAASKANLSARVVNGPMTVSGLPVDNPSGRRIRSLESMLNGGGPAIDLRVTNGSLTIAGK
jgi:putative adhesin